MSAGQFYTLRYVAGTPLSERAHGVCTSQWPTFVDADDERDLLPYPLPNLLEVVVRGVDR